MRVLPGEIRSHAECSNTLKKKKDGLSLSPVRMLRWQGGLADRPSGAVGAREIDAVDLGNRAEDAVELGSSRLVERLIGDL